MTTSHYEPYLSRYHTDRSHDSHVLAAWGRDLAGFAPADWGLVQRGQMIPAGRLHGVAGDQTLCGLPLADLYVFPQLRFETGAIGRQCPGCIAAG